MSITDQQKEILQHALGLNYRKTSFRNHYCAERETRDYRECLALVEMGLMREGRPLENGMLYFHVTEKGREEVVK